MLLALLVLAHLWRIPEGANLLYRALQNALHVPAFAVLSFFVAVVFSRLRSVHVVLLCLAAGLLLEAAQLLTSRDASLADLMSDTLGILLGLFIARGKPALKLAALIALVLATAWSPFQVWAAYQDRDARFPVLLNASLLGSPLFGSNSDVEPSTGDMLRICLADIGYPGVRLEEPPPDWRSYETLEVSFGVEGDAELRMTVAVNHVGSRGTSAYVSELFSPGTHTWQVPVAELQPEGARISLFNLHSYGEYAGQCLILATVTLR